MNKKLKLLACFGIALLVATFSAQAQVAVTATLPGTEIVKPAPPTIATSSTFDMNGGNAVALLFTFENYSSGDVISATFAGQPMTLGVWTNDSVQWSGIFYLINPTTTSGQFVITTSGSSAPDGAYSAIALGNVGSVADSNAVANTATSGTISLNYTTHTNGGFVLAACVNNGYSSAHPAPSYVSGNADQTLFGPTIVDANDGHLQAYGPVAVAGTQTDVYGNPYQRNAYVTLAFETAKLLPSLTWAVGSGTWDINTSANWTDGVNSQTYQEISGVGNNVTFDDTASGPSPITVTLNTAVNPSSVTVSNSAIDYTISGSGGISGGFPLVKDGSGTLTLGTANTFSGGVDLNGGTTVFSSINNLGSGPINFNGGTLQYNGNSDDISTRTVTFDAGGATIDDGGGYITFNNPVGNGGAGGLTKTGSGTLVLGSGFAAQSFDYYGNTVVANGTLYVNAYATLPNTPAIIVKSGATFDDSNNGLSLDGMVAAGDGTIAGPVTSSTGIITPGTNGVAGTLTFSGSLSMSGGSLDMDLSTNTGQSDQLDVGSLTISGGTLQLNVTGTLTNGIYKLIQYGSLSGSASAFTLTGYSQPGKSLTLDDSTPGEIDLVVADTANDNLVWTGTAGATWDLTGSLNWQRSGGGAWAYTNGDTVTFDPSGIASPNVSIQAAVSPSSVVVSNDVGSTYDFIDGGGKIKGATSLVKKGAGTLMVGTPNINTGGAIIEAGTVNVTGSLGSGSITNNGTLVFNQTANLINSSLTGTGSLTLQGSGSLTIGTGGADGALSASSITNNGTLILNSSSDWTYSIPDTGTGDLDKEGSNTLTMSGVNTRTGDTRVGGGKVVLGNANQLKGSADVEAGATLDMNGFDQFLLNLNSKVFSGGLVVNDAGTATNILTVSNSVAGDCSALVEDNEGSGGVIAFVKQGPGEMNWRGANTYSGGTTIEGGDIRATSSQLFGTGPVYMKGGGINIASSKCNITNITYLRTPVGATTNTIYPTANVYWGAPLVGTADLLFDFSRGGNNDTISINGGADKWAGVTNTCYLRGSGGYFRFDSGYDASGVTFDLNNSGVRINSTHAYNIQLGALIGNSTTAMLWPAGGSTFTIGAKNLSTTFAGELAGSASITSLTKVGTGTLTLTGTNNFTAALTVSNGVLALAQNAAPSSMSPIKVSSGAILDVTGLASSTLSLGTTNVAQTLSGAGTLNGSVVIGTNAIVSPGSNTGTLTINNALTLDGVAIMELNRANSQTADQIDAASISGTGAVNVTNVGPDLVAGDSFQLFNHAVPGVTVNLPVSNLLNTVEYVWTNRVDQDGSIAVLKTVSSINPNPPVMGATFSGGVLSLSWPTNAGWTLQMQTNDLASGLGTNWVDVPGSTSITSTNITVDPSKPTVFYRLKL